MSAAFILVVIVAIVFALSGGGDGGDGEAVQPTTPSTLAISKPCVARADPLPQGAPEVPVQTGPAPRTLVRKDLKVGTGDEVAPGATVRAHYIGVACSTGKIFDSSWSRGSPTEFSLNKVIKGWQDGIPGMKVGARRVLGIPADQAYGANPPEDSGIGPDEALWFVVDLVAVQ